MMSCRFSGRKKGKDDSDNDGTKGKKDKAVGGNERILECDRYALASDMLTNHSRAHSLKNGNELDLWIRRWVLSGS